MNEAYSSRGGIFYLKQFSFRVCLEQDFEISLQFIVCEDLKMFTALLYSQRHANVKEAALSVVTHAAKP